ncbi:MAG: hypothetical protein JNM82_06105 [Rhodocyclaceae bacterium]|nr:hypothetical protein [Rhodocyclaceae bacterium]
MARVLVAAAGSHGDVLPMVALGRELARRGREVVFYANPVFAAHAESAGLRFVPVGTAEGYASLFADAVDDDPRRAFNRIGREYEALGPLYYAAMARDVLPGRTMLAGGTLLFAPRLLGETAGAPCATLHLALAPIRSDDGPPRLLPRWIEASTPPLLKRLGWWLVDLGYVRSYGRPLNRERATLGLPPVRRPLRSWIHEADCVVGLFPDWFAPPQPDWPARIELAGFPCQDRDAGDALPPALAAFLEEGPPPVGVSAGTATASAGEFFRTSVAGCRAAGMRAVLLSPFDAHLPRDLPAGFLHVRYADYQALLPRLATFIHHGGIGATGQSLRAGVPQLIRPVAYDQFDNSARAQRLGVAVELLPRRYTAATLADTLGRMAADGAMRQRCREQAARFDDRDGIAVAADAMEACWRRRAGAADRP